MAARKMIMLNIAFSTPHRVCQNHVGSWQPVPSSVGGWICKWLFIWFLVEYCSRLFSNSTNNIFVIIIIYMVNANISISAICREVLQTNSVFASCQTLCQPIMCGVLGWNGIYCLSSVSSTLLFRLLSSIKQCDKYALTFTHRQTHSLTLTPPSAHSHALKIHVFLILWDFNAKLYCLCKRFYIPHSRNNVRALCSACVYASKIYQTKSCALQNSDMNFSMLLCHLVGFDC